jgi:hypothetical protein
MVSGEELEVWDMAAVVAHVLFLVVPYAFPFLRFFSLPFRYWKLLSLLLRLQREVAFGSPFCGIKFLFSM